MMCRAVLMVQHLGLLNLGALRLPQGSFPPDNLEHVFGLAGMAARHIGLELCLETVQPIGEHLQEAHVIARRTMHHVEEVLDHRVSVHGQPRGIHHRAGLVEDPEELQPILILWVVGVELAIGGHDIAHHHVVRSHPDLPTFL